MECKKCETLKSRVMELLKINRVLALENNRNKEVARELSLALDAERERSEP